MSKKYKNQSTNNIIRGFTLVELLAVIVILAIISIIAIPIVIHIIDDSKKSSEKESIKLYLDTVEKMVAKYQMNHTSFDPNICDIQDSGNIKCNDVDITIEMKGKTPTYGKIYFSKGKISIGENILLNGLYYQVQNNEVSVGTKEMVSGFSSVINKIELAVGNYTGTCEVTNTNKLTCGNEEKTIDTNKSITKGTIVFTNGKITSYKNVNVDGTYYHKKEGEEETITENEVHLCKRESAANNTSITLGDKYKCNVNDIDTFNFYVLSIEDDKVNLIMDRNICNDGTVNYTSTNNYCRYKWYSKAANNTYGPVTAMQELYSGTKDWNNVPDMVMNYIDENNGDSEDKGYTSIITSNGVTTITGKPTTRVTTIGTSAKPLKARLPKQSEVMGAGCTTGTCPVWLVENMKYWNVSNDKYSINNNTEVYQNIQGYWLLSSFPGGSLTARLMTYGGYIDYNGGNCNTNNGNYSARPVITVSTSDLSN